MGAHVAPPSSYTPPVPPDPPSDQPVRALLERLGLETAPTLTATGQFAPLPEDGPTIGRLRLKRELGRGGMGTVHAAHDPELARDVAVKVLRGGSEATPERIARFVSEAQITAQLQHPGIVPVHEIGVHADGALYYVMKRLRGRSVRELLLAWDDGEERWSLRRIVTMFAQVCDALAFAHSRRVLHRDIKPENLMVGDFGEVLVVDWGLAALLGAPGERARGERATEPTAASPKPPSDGRVRYPQVRRTTSSYTEDGDTLGSPGYMSPEQARGDHGALGPETDVFALGCVLYELMTGVRAYIADNPLSLMFKLMSGPPAPPSEVAPDAGIPDELAAVAMQAMAADPADRPADASVLARRCRAWLDGDARREAARAHLEQAHVRWDAYLAVRDEQAQLADKERRLDQETPPWTPMADKAELLGLGDRLARLGEERLSAFSSFVTACDQARAKDPDSSEAADLLADGWWVRLREAEAEGDLGRARWCADRVRELAPERYAERLEGTGAVVLVTEPAGAEVICQRVRREGVVWSLGEPSVLGTTPLEVPLPMGSWLLTLRKDGFADVRYPVFLRRAQVWDGPPVRLLTDEQIGAGWVYVPAGPFLSCGDSGALEARPEARPVLDGFLIRELPLSLTDYLGFVNGLHREDPDAAWDCVPAGESGVQVTGRKYWERPEPGEDYVIPPVDKDGDAWDPAWPTFGISWHHAQRCARWHAAQTGEDVRLPSILQWEKAARGVDGRIWPWGDRFDSTLAKIRTSLPGRPMPVPVGTYKTDVSIYGMRDVAGCIRELCGDATFDGNEMLRPVVGASWNHLPDAARCASRLGTSHWNRSAFMGFRLARGLPE